MGSIKLLLVHYEVYNGVWDALVDGRTDIVIGATRAIPVTASFAFRDMGSLHWLCVASPAHPLTSLQGPLNDEQLRPYPSLCMDDTSRSLPKRDTWTLDNQRRMMSLVPGDARRAGGEGPLQRQGDQAALCNQGLRQMRRHHADAQSITQARQARGPVGYHHSPLIIQRPSIALGQAA